MEEFDNSIDIGWYDVVDYRDLSEFEIKLIRHIEKLELAVEVMAAEVLKEVA